MIQKTMDHSRQAHRHRPPTPMRREPPEDVPWWVVLLRQHTKQRKRITTQIKAKQQVHPHQMVAPNLAKVEKTKTVEEHVLDLVFLFWFFSCVEMEKGKAL
jgi:hypothetical protein